MLFNLQEFENAGFSFSTTRFSDNLFWRPKFHTAHAFLLVDFTTELVWESLHLRCDKLVSVLGRVT